MKTTLFNPLKIYKKNLNVIDFLLQALGDSSSPLVVPYASHCYYTLSLRDKIPITYNFTNEDYYTFWDFISTDSEKLHDLMKLFYKPPLGMPVETYYQTIEREYHNLKSAIYKPIMLMILSRTNHNLNLYGGPYSEDYSKCFSNWYYDKLKNFSNKKMHLSNNRKLVWEQQFFLQHIPRQGSLEFEDAFGDTFPIDNFRRMNNFVLICEDSNILSELDYDNEIKFEDCSLIIRSS